MFVHHARVRPPLPQPSWFERPLAKRVAEHGGVVSVVAGPGIGKTVLAAQVYAAHRGPKLWYGFDAADCDLAVFATHFDAVRRSLGRAPQLEGENWRLGSTKEIASIFAGAFAEIEALPLLVFDDVHLFEHSRSLDVLSDFVARLTHARAAAFATLHEPRLRWAAESDAHGGASEPLTALRIDMLGGLHVTVRGEAIPAEAWTRRKARDLFAHLVTLQGRACSRSRLVDLYWPELEGDAAHDALRVTVSAIRKAVGNVIEYEDGGYRFVAPAGTALDVHEFERAIEAARAAEAHGTLDAAHAAFLLAVTVYRGDFLEGAEDAASLWRERDRLRKPYLAALRWLVRHPSDDLERNVELLDRLLDQTPFDVEAVKLRLDVMTGDSRGRDAAAEYERWKTAYRATVGSEAPEIWQPPALAQC